MPLLDFYREIDAVPGVPTKGIQLSDRDPAGSPVPSLHLSIYFKTTNAFVRHILPTGEKWLFVQADMRPALNLRLQVRAWNDRDVGELMEFLRTGRGGYRLCGPNVQDQHHPSDFLAVWRENNENRLMISTFMPTLAGLSVHARFSSSVAEALAHYLEEVGFAERPE